MTVCTTLHWQEHMSVEHLQWCHAVMPADDCRSNTTETMGLSKQRASQGIQLHGIIVHGPNGTVYDLSSAFNPDVDEYGTSVPPTFVNGSLCILPGTGEASAEGFSSTPGGANDHSGAYYLAAHANSPSL